MRWLVIAWSILVVGCGPSPTSTDGSGSSGSSGASGSSGSSGSTAASAADESGPGVAPGCFPETGHGEFIAEHASGLRVYASCSDAYFIEHPGDDLIATVEGVDAVRDASVSDLFEVPDVHSVGTGLCCGEPCIDLTVQVYGFSLQTLLAVVAEAFPEAEGQCFGINVRFIGDDGPRCETTDPECLPVPVCNGFHDRDGLCCNAPDFDPAAARVPVGDAVLSGGACSHDGDCVLRGAGNHCKSWQTPDFVGLLDCYPDLSEAFCGCVDDACHWFNQG